MHNTLGSSLEQLQNLIENNCFEEASELSDSAFCMGHWRQHYSIIRNALDLPPVQPILIGALESLIGRVILESQIGNRNDNKLPGVTEYLEFSIMCRRLGNNALSLKAAYSALQDDPQNIKCHYLYSNLGGDYSDDEMALSAVKSYNDSSTLEDKIVGSFSLGRIFESRDDFEKAFGFFANANMLKNSCVNYDPAAFRNVAKNIIDLFSGKKLGDVVLKVENPKTNPILVLGLPRSGTTLVENVISANSLVFASGEIGALPSIMHGYSDVRLSTLSEVISEVSHKYHSRIEEISGRSKYLTDKTCMNFVGLGFLLAGSPNLRVVSIIRDPMAVAWSNYKRLFASKGQDFTYSLENIYSHTAVYFQMMKFWQRQFPDKFLNVRYEEFTDRPEEVTAAIFNFLGSDFLKAKNFSEPKPRMIKTASSSQVREKLYKGSSSQWRKFEPMLKGASSQFYGLMEKYN